MHLQIFASLAKGGNTERERTSLLCLEVASSQGKVILAIICSRNLLISMILLLLLLLLVVKLASFSNSGEFCSNGCLCAIKSCIAQLEMNPF